MKIEYLHKISYNKKQYDGFYIPYKSIIQIDKNLTVAKKLLVTFHEMTHWFLDKLTDNADIYEKFSNIVDKIQDSILPW